MGLDQIHLHHQGRKTARLDGYEINDDLLNASYQRLKTQHDMIQDIYTEFPSKNFDIGN